MGLQKYIRNGSFVKPGSYAWHLLALRVVALHDEQIASSANARDYLAEASAGDLLRG